MAWYDIYLLQFVFQPVAVVVDLYKNRKETVQNEKKYTRQYENNTKYRIHKMENKNTKQNTNLKGIWKNK